MGVTDHLPDSDPLLNCSLKLDALKTFTYNAASLDEDNISLW